MIMNKIASALEEGAHSKVPKEPGDDLERGLSFEVSSLEEDLLSLLVGKEMYGLQIADAFKDASGGKRGINISRLYPALSRLEHRGLVSSRMADRPSHPRGGARRKYYQITKKGVLAFAEVQQFREKLSIWQPSVA